jgi:hypothetical protein
MTRREFKSAVMRLLVDSGPDRIVTARPLAQSYLKAAIAFTSAGAGAWLSFMKRTIETLDENAARAEFLAWLKVANEKELGRFIEAANRYRPALLRAGEKIDRLVQRERIAFGESASNNEKGTIWKGAEGRALWRMAEREAGSLAQKSKAGKNSGKNRGAPVRNEVERLAELLWNKKPRPQSRLDLARIIQPELDKSLGLARSQDRIDTILHEIEISKGIQFRR